MRVGRFLVQGVDVWLNNPRRPLEASGTSGMKAAQNGVPEHQRARRLVGRGLRGRQRLGDRRARAEPGRGRAGLVRRRGPVPAARAGARPGLLRPRQGRRPAALGRGDAPRDGDRRSGTSRRRGCSRSTPSTSTCPAAGVEVAAPPPSRSSPRPADARAAAAHLAGARAPQPPAGRELRLGLRRGLREGLRADGRCARAASRRPAVAPLHGAAARLARRRARRTIDRLRALVERGQVEILGGGYYEPVLASLPERDRVGQLRRMADELEGSFGRAPRGAWLAERVWEPDLPTSLVAAGYGWTILDDAHFRAAAIPEDELWGPYTTEDQGRLLAVFGTEQGLRYRIPFRDVEDVIAYLRDHATDAGDRVGMMGDDGEKFGGWPTTWEHCWGERRWVERFFTALEANADWLTTTTPSAWLADHAPIGRVYVPTGSYAEMGEWALPADESRRVRGRPPPRAEGAPARGALAAWRVLAQLPGQVPRDQRPPQADAARLRRGRGDAGRPGPRRARSTTSTRASRTTATGMACSAASTSATCGSRRTSTSSPPRTSPTGPRRSARAPSGATSTWTAIDEVRLADDGPGRDGRSRPRAPGSALGHPPGPARAGRGHAAAAGGLPRELRAARARNDGGRRSATATTRTRRHRSTTPCMTKEPGLADLLVYDAYERRSGPRPRPPERHDRRGVGGGGRRTSATSSTDRSRSRSSRPDV